MSHQLVGFRFSGNDRVVDGEAVRLQDPAVGRHDVARLHEDDVAHDELVGGHLFFDALAKDVSGNVQVMYEKPLAACFKSNLLLNIQMYNKHVIITQILLKTG